jgi:hypothetical protein
MTDGMTYEEEELSPDLHAALTLDRAHTWAINGTIVVQILLVAAVWGDMHRMAELMAGFSAAAFIGLCAWTLAERNDAPDAAAALGAAGTLLYLLVAGAWTQWGPAFWLGVAMLGLISAAGNRAWSCVRQAAILGIVAATAAHETHDLARVLAFTAAAAVPYLGLELKLALQRRAQIGAVAAGRLDFAPQQRI